MINAIRQWWLVTKRETHHFLVTPVFWVLGGVFFFISSIVFLGLIIGFSQPELREQNGQSSDITISVIQQLFWILHYFLLIQIPLLTMRSISEDRRQGTHRLLRTMPMGEWPLLLGKYTANCLVMSLYLALTLVFPLLVEWISEPYWPVIITCYAALFLSLFAYTAIGIFFSSLTDSQVVAAVLTYVFLFALIVFTSITDSLAIQPLMVLSKHLSSISHVESFLDGQISARDIMYYVVVSAAFLFFTARQLESMKWRDQAS